MSQIEGDDPNIMSLVVGDNGFYPSNGDWAVLGRAIGRNTHLQDLVCHGPKECCNDLFRGVASNRSIQKISLNTNGTNHMNDEMTNIVADGLIRYVPLKDLAITGAYVTVGWIAIFDSLQTNENCSLETLMIHDSYINDAAALSLSRMLLRHSATLKTLDLHGCIGRRFQHFTIAS